MTQVEKNSLPPGTVKEFYIGSIMSGGGGNPKVNTAENWLKMVTLNATRCPDQPHHTIPEKINLLFRDGLKIKKEKR